MLKTTSRVLIQSILMLLVLMVITGGIYPVAMTIFGRVVFPSQAGGSILTRSDGSPIGSSLIAQNFTSDIYFWPRPSASNYGVTFDNNGNLVLAASGASNLGPTSAALQALVQQRAAAIIAANNLPPDTPLAKIPSDLLFASGSGLDPDISPAAAQLQVARVASARGVTVDQVQAIVNQYTEQPQFGVFGEPRVNVVLVNLALDNAGYFQDF